MKKNVIVSLADSNYFPLLNDLFGSMINQDNIEAKKLANLFKENFKEYGEEVKYLLNSGPII